MPLHTPGTQFFYRRNSEKQFIPQPNFPLRQENTLSKTIQSNNNSNRGTITTSWIYITLPFQGDRALKSLSHSAGKEPRLPLEFPGDPVVISRKARMLFTKLAVFPGCPPATRVCLYMHMSEYVCGTVNVRCFPRLYL